MVEVNASVSYCHDRILRICQVCLLVKYLADTTDTCHGHTDHNDHHGEHHQAHQKGHNITEQAGQVTSGHRAADNKLRTEP